MYIIRFELYIPFIQMISSKDPRYCDDTVLQNANHFVSLTQKNKKTNPELLNFVSLYIQNPYIF